MINGKKLLNQPGDFWRFLHYVENLSNPQSLEEVGRGLQALHQTSWDDKKLKEWTALLQEWGHPVSEKSLSLPRNARYGPLSFGQWLALWVRAALFDSFKGKIFNRHLGKRWKHLEEVYPLSDLEALLTCKISSKSSLASALERAISKKTLLLLELRNGKRYTLFLHRLLIFNGSLGVLGEEVKSCSLLFFALESIQHCKPVSKNQTYRPNFTSREVERFIHAMREMEGTEERLVLRIKDPGKIDLDHPYHFLGAPYVTANREGEVIWAASVEISEELFHWLSSMREHIEIVDPWELRPEFEEYCNNTLFSRLQSHKHFKKSS